jgi:hypothetical protein
MVRRVMLHATAAESRDCHRPRPTIGGVVRRRSLAALAALTLLAGCGSDDSKTSTGASSTAPAATATAPAGTAAAPARPTPTPGRGTSTPPAAPTPPPAGATPSASARRFAAKAMRTCARRNLRRPMILPRPGTPAAGSSASAAAALKRAKAAYRQVKALKPPADARAGHAALKDAYERYIPLLAKLSRMGPKTSPPDAQQALMATLAAGRQVFQAAVAAGLPTCAPPVL